MQAFPQLYLAGPFFTPEQEKVQASVEALCESLGVSYFSPRKECRISKDDPRSKMAWAFDSNCKGVDACDIVLANIEGFDTGTVWELAYAYAHGKYVVAYSFVPGRKLNLMLALSCNGFIDSLETMRLFLDSPKRDGRATYNWSHLTEHGREVF